MKIINGKYRIDKLINNNRSYSMYEATDIMKNKKKVSMYILNTNHIEKSLLELCIYEFEKIHITKGNYMNILDFGSLVNLSDKNKKVEYYYITEINSYYKPLLEAVEGIDEEKLLEIFIDVCKLAQDQCYSCIKTMPFTIDSMYVTKDFKIKLKDKITTLLDCREVGVAIHYDASGEEKGGISNKTVNNVYYLERLREILVNIVLTNKGIQLYGKAQKDILENIVNEKNNKYINLIGQRMSALIYSLYNNTNEVKEDKILYVIEVVNSIYKTSYVYRSNKKEILNFNTPIVGRKQEILSIMDSINNIIKYDQDKNIILLHGEIGIGKTRLINHIKYVIDINYKNTLKCFYVTDYESNLAISNLLRQIIVSADRGLLNKYKKELSMIMPEVYGGGIQDQYSVLDFSNKINLELMAKIALFLQEYYVENPSMIILDNVHTYDDFSLGVIQYILSKPKGDKRIPVVISYRDGDCLSNYAFTKLIAKINYRVDMDIYLTPLSENMASIILKNILNVDRVTDEFRDTLYKYSMGNPLFIEEGIKYLRDRKVIYVDECNGMWKKVSNHEIYMSTDMEEACKGQLEDLNDEDISILHEMSFFYMAVSLEVMSEVLGISEVELTDKINKLVSKGILYKKLNEGIINYTFYNNFLRNYLYTGIDEIVKLNKHREISQALIKYCEENIDAYVEETIYHLEKIKDKRVLSYYKKSEERLEKLNNIKDAIKCNLKILEFIDENKQGIELLQDEINANMTLGNLYNKLYEKSTSVEYYIRAKELCSEEKNIKDYIDILRELIYICMDLGLDKNIIKYTMEMKNAVDNSNYNLGKIKYLSVIVWKLYNNQQYDKVKKVCNYGISLCGDEDTEYKLSFMNSYGDSLIVEGYLDEGLKFLKSMVQEYSDPKYKQRLCRISNSIGVVYSDYIQCGEEALVWFEKAYDMGVEGSYNVTALSNLGFIHYIMLNYEKAYECFNLGSNYAIENEILYCNFYNFSYIGIILYKMAKYGESFKYAKLCSHYIDKEYGKYWQDAGPYCIFMYYICALRGEKHEARKYLNEAIEILNDSNSLIKYEIDLLFNMDILCNEENIGSVDNVIKAAEKILYIDLRVSMFCFGIMRLINLGHNNEAMVLYRYANESRDKINADSNKLTLDYLGFVLDGNISYKKLIEDLKVYNNESNPMLLWKIYYEISNQYYCENNFIYASEYIIESCDLIIHILEDIPSKYIKGFIIEEPNIVKVFELMRAIQNHFGIKKEKIKIPIKIDKIDDIVGYFKEIIQENIVNNNFLNELKRYNKDQVNGVNSIDDILNKLGADTHENLFNICNYINMFTLSAKTTILIDNEGKFSPIASSDDKNEIPEDISLINVARSKRIPILLREKKVTNVRGEIVSYDIDNNIKAAICIPITQVIKNKRGAKVYGYTHDLVGYIYLESKRRINNINITTMKKCITISRVLYMILDRYNIRKSASIDNLTNTLMRKHLELFIQDQIEKAYTYGSEFSIIMLDIDKFKEINDNYGHRMGDRVLSNLCKIILGNIRKGDVIGRYGGEEFIIVLPGSGVNEAKIIAERIKNKVYQGKLMNDKRDVTVSMGVANYPRHATTYDELIEKSDQALYVAKNSGRNRTTVWNESYGLKISTTNRLSGIFVGNGDQDYKNVSTVMEFIDLINEQAPIEEKIATTINRISEITEAEICTLYSLKDSRLIKEYCKISEQCQISGDEEYNFSIVSSAIKTKENICSIDWNYIKESNESMSIPDIKSNMVVLLRKKSAVIGALHLISSINHKEFTFDELNYINNLSKIMVPMLEEI